MSGGAPPQNRNRDDLRQIFRTPLERWLADMQAWCKPRGLSVLVYETHRTAQRQAYLYAQGRTRPGPVITYTLDSAHEYGVAVDWCPLRLVEGDWVQDWSHATYAAIYAACPPQKYGLEKLPWEAPHIQLAGVNGADQKQPASVWAARQGFQANAIVPSRWPLPAPVTTPAPRPPVAAARRVFVRGLDGKNTTLTAPAIYAGQLITALPGGDVQVGALRLRVYEDGALQFDRAEPGKGAK